MKDLDYCINVESCMKDLINFEGYYKIDESGNIFSIKNNRHLTPYIKGEYPRIKLSKNNKDYMFAVHKLVAINFLGEPSNPKYIINHIDGNKLNPHFSNLEYVTSAENSIHSLKNNLKKITKGSENGNNKLSEKEVVEIYNSNLLYSEISIIYNISTTLISLIKNNKKWTYLDKTKKNLSDTKKPKYYANFDYKNCKILIESNKYKIDINGNILNIKTNKIVKPVLNNGYLRIYLCGYNYHIHRLVANNFIKNVDLNKNVVNHIDGNKLNNNVSNLEWTTVSENAKHYHTILCTQKLNGESIGTSKLKESDVTYIFKGIESNKELGKIFNVSISTIGMIKNRKIWKHITNTL
jgi:hypothetical protein